MGWSEDVHSHRQVLTGPTEEEDTGLYQDSLQATPSLTTSKAARSVLIPASPSPEPRSLSGNGIEGLGPLLLVGAALCSSAVAKVTAPQRRRNGKNSRRAVPARSLPAPILVSPRGDRPKTPRGDRPKTPRRVYFSDEPEIEGETPRTPRTPRTSISGRPPLHPPSRQSVDRGQVPPSPRQRQAPQPSAAAGNTAGPQLPRLPPPGQVWAAASGPPREAAAFLLRLPLQLAAIVLAGLQHAGNGVAAGGSQVGRSISAPFQRQRRSPLEQQSAEQGERPRRPSVEIPSLQLAQQGLSGDQRASKPKKLTMAQRCEAAEAEVEKQKAAAKALEEKLSATEAQLKTALDSGKSSREALAAESARRAQALTEANKQLEKLEAKLRSRQATVEGLAQGIHTPRGLGQGPPPSPRSSSSFTLASPRIAMSPRSSIASPKGSEKGGWPQESPRHHDGAAHAERRIAELRALLTAQQARTDEANEKAEDLQAQLNAKAEDIAALEAKLASGLSEAQAATIAELQAALAAEQAKAQETAQLVKHLQESLTTDAETIQRLEMDLQEAQSIIDSFEDQAANQVAYVQDLQDMCEELQGMQATMSAENEEAARQAKTLQEQLNVSLAVIERLEAAAEEQKKEYSQRRAQLETQLEDSQSATEEAKRKLAQAEEKVRTADEEREAAIAALKNEKPHFDDKEWDGRVLPSVKRLSTREEELYKQQIGDLQMQLHAIRKDARAARGAETDSSVGVQQLEARLAVAAIEHKQDVRRLQETIENLEDQLRVMRRHAMLSGARKGSAALESGGESGGEASPKAPSVASAEPAQRATSVASGNGSGSDAGDTVSESGSSTAPGSPAPTGPGPYANRLLALTRRLEDVMGVSLQRTNSAQRASLDRRGSSGRPSGDLGRMGRAPGNRFSLDQHNNTGVAGAAGLPPRMSMDTAAMRRPPRSSTERRSVERGALRASSTPPLPTIPASPTSSLRSSTDSAHPSSPTAAGLSPGALGKAASAPEGYLKSPPTSPSATGSPLAASAQESAAAAGAAAAQGSDESSTPTKADSSAPSQEAATGTSMPQKAATADAATAVAPQQSSEAAADTTAGDSHFKNSSSRNSSSSDLQDSFATATPRLSSSSDNLQAMTH